MFAYRSAGPIARCGGSSGSRSAELGQRRNLSPSGISRSVDRLAKLGLLERGANPDDRRSLLVGLTSEGMRRLRDA
jgi:DNA-binding MarR family transcriptional regulator